MVMTQIYSEGLMKGNSDVTDEAQKELHKALARKEMTERFVQVFFLPPVIPYPHTQGAL